MNGFTENKASNAPEPPEGREVVLTWSAARRMIPLVQRIVDDIVQWRQRLALLQPEKDRLDRQRRTLAWPERARRYELHEEITLGERTLIDALQELAHLGLTLVEPDAGQVGFPTAVNNRRAFFSWRPGEEGLHYWHFVEESVRRPIPVAWTRPSDSQRAGRS